MGTPRLRLNEPALHPFVALAAVLVVEQQCLRIGLMGPTESLFDIGCVFFREADAGLIEPWRILQPAVLVQSFVDYIPGENLSSVVLSSP